MDTDGMSVVVSHRVGPYYSPTQSRPRQLIMKFANLADRNTVWAKRSSLKGTGSYISEIERRRKVLRPYLQAARLGDPVFPNAHISAYLNNLHADKLIINKRVYTVHNADQLPGFV